jgi:hypothetical protein
MNARLALWGRCTRIVLCVGAPREYTALVLWVDKVDRSTYIGHCAYTMFRCGFNTASVS